MPDLSRIPEVLYDPLNPYHYSFDNAPLKAILQRIDVVNGAVDQVVNAVNDSIGIAGSLNARLSQSLDSSGNLETTAVDASNHSIEAHADGQTYVRYLASERAKLWTIADNATNLSLRVVGPQDTFLNSGTIVLQSTPGVQWGVQGIQAGIQSSAILKANLTFLGAIHRHFYDQPAIPQFNPSDYQNYATAANPIPFKDGSLRVLVNGYELTTDPDNAVYVPIGSLKTATLLYFIPTFGQGLFSLNQAITSYDTIRIDFDCTIGTADDGSTVAPGAQGPQGFQGDIGVQGDQGYQGIGYQGYQGLLGPQGYQGFGQQGDQGYQGFGANYSNVTPLPITIGGFQAGMVLTDLTMQQMWDLFLYPYMQPSFSSFYIQDVATAVEVGFTIQDTQTFIWTDTNSENIKPNSIALYDTTNSVTLGVGIGDTGFIAISLPDPVVYNTPSSNTWTIQAANSDDNLFSRTYTVDWQWLTYWGISDLTSLDSSTVPTLGSSILANGVGNTYAFSATEYKYLAFPADFAPPSSFTSGGFNIAMADSTDDPAFDNTANGYSFQMLMITNIYGVETNYRIYRTENILGGSISIQVS